MYVIGSDALGMDLFCVQEGMTATLKWYEGHTEGEYWEETPCEYSFPVSGRIISARYDGDLHSVALVTEENNTIWFPLLQAGIIQRLS